MYSDETLIDEKFMKIDGVIFRVNYRYNEEADRYFGMNTFLYNGASFEVYIQNEEQNNLIIDYNIRTINKKVRKIKGFYRCSCFAYKINKLKFDTITLMNEGYNTARFYTNTKNRYWASHKDHYNVEEIKICKKLDLEYENNLNSLSGINKFNL